MNYKIIKNGSCKVNRKLLNKSEKMGNIDVPANIIQIEYRNYNIIIDAGYGQNALKVTKKFPERFMRWLTPLTPGAIDVNTLAIEGKKNILIYSHYHIDHVGNFNYDKKFVCYGSKLELETILNQGKIKNIKQANIKSLIDTNQEINPIENLNKASNWLNKYFTTVYQFEEKQIFLVNLSGHSQNQFGVIIPELNFFYIADAAYSANDIINNNFGIALGLLALNKNKAKDTFNKVILFHKENPEYKIITAHDWETNQ